MRNKSLSNRVTYKRKANHLEAREKADKNLVESAAERLAELFYEQCVMKKNLSKESSVFPEDKNTVKINL